MTRPYHSCIRTSAPPTNHSDKTAGGLLETRMYEYRRRTTGYSDAVQHGQRPHVALQQTNHRRQHTTWEWPHRNPQARHGKFRGANPGGGAWDFGCSQTRVLAEKMAGEGNKHETPFLQGGYCDERRARPSERAQRRAGQGRAGHPAGTEYSIHAAAAVPAAVTPTCLSRAFTTTTTTTTSAEAGRHPCHATTPTRRMEPGGPEAPPAPRPPPGPVTLGPEPIPSAAAGVSAELPRNLITTATH